MQIKPLAALLIETFCNTPGTRQTKKDAEFLFKPVSSKLRIKQLFRALEDYRNATFFSREYYTQQHTPL